MEAREWRRESIQDWVPIRWGLVIWRVPAFTWKSPGWGGGDKWTVFALWRFLFPPAPLTGGREAGPPRDGEDFSPSFRLPGLKLLGCRSGSSDTTFCFSCFLGLHLIVTESCVRALRPYKKLPKGGLGLCLSESACICAGCLLSTPFSIILVGTDLNCSRIFCQKYL